MSLLSLNNHLGAQLGSHTDEGYCISVKPYQETHDSTVREVHLFSNMKNNNN